VRWNAFPSLFLALRFLLARDIQKYPFTGAGSGLKAGGLAVGVRHRKEMVSRCEACEVLSEFQVR
jgi:hypothetical protein